MIFFFDISILSEQPLSMIACKELQINFSSRTEYLINALEFESFLFTNLSRSGFLSVFIPANAFVFLPLTVIRTYARKNEPKRR